MGSAALRGGEVAPVGCAVEERVRALVAEHLGIDRGASASGRRDHPGARGGDLRRAGPFTPYTRELVVEDALRAGRGARLELTLPAATDDATLATVHEWFGRLVERGIELSIRRLVG